jgi:Holliday junction DNA helicase RuvA
MYDYLKGILVTKNPTRLVVDVGGVGYELTVPLSTSAALGEDSNVKVYAHLHVREDQHRLYGFATRAERTMFRHLIALSGIGPGVALTVLSHTPVEDFVRAVLAEDYAFLQRIKGIGEKTAKRLVLELKPLADTLLAEVPAAARAVPDHVEEACMALISLGYTRAVAEKAIKRALADFETDPTTEELLKQTFRYT